MKLSVAEKRGKLVDKIEVYKRFQMICITDNKKSNRKNIYHLLTLKEIEDIMVWYFKQLCEHIRTHNKRLWPLRGIGSIYHDEAYMKYLKAKWKEEKKEKHEV